MRTVYFKNGLTRNIPAEAALEIGQQAAKGSIKFFCVMDNDKFMFLLNMDEVLYIG